MIRRLCCTLAMLLAAATLAPLHAQTDQRCFPETGFCIAGRIRSFWEGNGGLPVFGYPKGPQQDTLIEGKTLQAQAFERNRLELHGENQPPYDVLLGRLGADRLAQQGRDPFTFPASTAQDGCRYFAETKHNVCGPILAAWRASGLEFDGQRGTSEPESLALFGLPLSDMQTETIDGKDLQVQWFERARFEVHGENQPPYNVLLGLLGNELAGTAQPGAPVPPPDTAAPAPPTAAPAQPGPRPLPAPTYNNCQADPNPAAAPNYPVQIVGIDKSAETVTLKNVGPDAVNLDGWHMCSITGNQQHPVSGTLAPGQQQVFPGPSGPIWNNSQRDDGALYNAQGQLVSYLAD